MVINLHVSNFLHVFEGMLFMACSFKNLKLASLIGQFIKNPSAMQETLVQFLGWEDPLKKGKVTQFSILALRIP